MTMQKVFTLHEAEEFAEVAEMFLRGEVGIRDICEARKRLLFAIMFDFDASEDDAQSAVNAVGKYCGLL